MGFVLLVKFVCSVLVGLAFQSIVADLGKLRPRPKIFIFFLVMNCFFIGWGVLCIVEKI